VGGYARPPCLRPFIRIGIDAFDEFVGVGAGPVGMLPLEVGADPPAGGGGGVALVFHRQSLRADAGDQLVLGGDERRIPRRAVVGHHVFHLQRGHFVEHREPAGGRAAVAENVGDGLVLHHVAGDQGVVRLDQGKFVPLGVCLAEPEQRGRDPSAEVDGGFLVKRDVGGAQGDVGEQVFELRGDAAEHVDHLPAVGLHFALLGLVADQDGAGREAAFAAGVFGVEVGRRQKQFRVAGGEFCGHAGCTIVPEALRVVVRTRGRSNAAGKDSGVNFVAT
jgi:hypothetical protein